MGIRGGLAAAAAALLVLGCASGGGDNDQRNGGASSGPVSFDIPKRAFNAVQGAVMEDLRDFPRFNAFFQLPPRSTSMDFALYRYGNYCGAGWPEGLQSRPSGQPETADQRQERHLLNISTLRNVEPPQDYIDALCFAHDYCYDVMGRDSLACDAAMLGASLETLERFYTPAQAVIEAAEGDLAARNFSAVRARFQETSEEARASVTCGNQVVDIALAFLVKPPVSAGGQNNAREAGVYASRMYRTLETYADGGNWRGYVKEKLGLQSAIGYNSDETCVFGDASRPRALTPAEFEDALEVFARHANNEALETASGFQPLRGRDVMRFVRQNWEVFAGYGQKLWVRAPRFDICRETELGDCAEQDEKMVRADWNRLSRKHLLLEARAVSDEMRTDG